MIDSFKAAILYKKHKVKIENIKFKNLRKGQVLIKIDYSGICGSQYFEYNGERGKDKYLPHCFGHEASGQVIDTHKSISKVKKGDKVIISWIKGRGIESEKISFKNLLNKKINFGPVTTFSNYAVVSENRVYKKPNNMNMLEAVLYGCAIPTGAGMVLKEKQLKKSKKFLVIGLGGIGYVTLYTLLTKKVRQVDVLEIDKNKIRKFKLLRKTSRVNFIIKSENIKKNYYDFCFETSGNINVLNKTINFISNKGKVIFATHPKYGEKLSINPHELIKGKKIHGSWGGGCELDKDIKKIFNFFKKKSIFHKKLIKIIKLNNLTEALNEKKRPFRTIIKM